ncbi:MAG: hypothetical protein ABSG46_18035 [Candidatus Binataceae bacterium]
MQDLKKNTEQALASAEKSVYQTPTVTDYGDVMFLTQAPKGTQFDGTVASGASKAGHQG